MKPLNPPPSRWATRTRAQPRGLVHPCRNKTTQQRASARYPARQRVRHRSNTQGSSVSGQEQAQHREPLFSERCKYSIEGAQLCEYLPGTPKNDPSAGRVYPRDLRAGILQASDHRHPPGASPTHAPATRAPSAGEPPRSPPFSRGFFDMQRQIVCVAIASGFGASVQQL